MTASREPYEGRAIKGFASDLTAWRKQMGLTKSELAARLGYDASLVGQVEACKNIPSRDFAEDCDSFFHAPGTFVRRWQEIGEERDLSLLPPGFQRFLRVESKATVRHIFEVNVITGLLQTPEYAYETVKPGYSSDEAEALVATRMARGKLLLQKSPPNVIVVLDESALRRRLGNDGVMRGQYRHLLDLAGLPNVTLHIVPADAGYYPGIMGPFYLLGFPDRPHMVYTEGHVGGNLTEHRPTVQQYQLNFDLIRGVALSARESLKLVREAWEAE
ncbi:helix-turn-helix domain-containing protein [Actinomadura gamaensis]|uniref:Scr1 family TA system antitoxin-like transcriptional regulator n=1 Tax=Actinomadura gamaensis TaxID=1763541 RepID=A0ABV9U3I6_9ACTN